MGPNTRALRTNWGQPRPPYPQESPNWGYNNRRYPPWKKNSNEQYPPRRQHERWRPRFREEKQREEWQFEENQMPSTNLQSLTNKDLENFPHQRLGDNHLRSEEYGSRTSVKRKLEEEGERNVQPQNPKKVKEY